MRAKQEVQAARGGIEHRTNGIKSCKFYYLGGSDAHGRRCLKFNSLPFHRTAQPFSYFILNALNTTAPSPKLPSKIERGETNNKR